MRRLTGFDCEGRWCAATLDDGADSTGLLIVSGGNEIRSGAHGGQASIAAHFAGLGYPVFRYDRRGIGESEGDNGGFESSATDIAAAVAAFRHQAPHITRIVAFGNCDAASALALFHAGISIDRLLLANPWVIESSGSEDAPASPSSATIRARYWQRLKNPRSLIDLLTGKIDLKKLAGGLLRAAEKQQPSGLANRLATVLAEGSVPVTLLLAKNDTTALAFSAAWRDEAFSATRNRADVSVHELNSASHSFADAASKSWLVHQIGDALNPPASL